MSRCLVSFGANIGNALETIRSASSALQQLLGKAKNEPCEDYRISRFFRTPPVGGPIGQPPFVNAVAAFETDLSVWEVWGIIRKIEEQFGRERNRRWEARKLDLDILLFDDQRVWTAQLKIPHPRMCMRRFILLPACDVAADWKDPVSGIAIKQIAENLQSRPANLTIFCDSEPLAKPLLIEAGLQARARWVGAEEAPSAGHDRWLKLHQLKLHEKTEAHPTHLDTNLRVFLVGLQSSKAETEMPNPREDGAWEDRYRTLACQLRMTRPGEVTEFMFNGPRYLLDASDPQWAIHELVAAFDAMDCPVEPF